MLTTARPIFEHVPATFADPVGLADQQAEGVVSLIVVRYPARSEAAAEPDPLGMGAVLGPTYDAFVAVSGQLLAVARTTPDYRFPVTPATALARFLRARDAGRPASGGGPFLSLYELAETDCARFLETVFYAECLKLHVSGPDSASLVADQIALSGCGNGVLEVNDFSDADAPRVQLVDLDDLAPATPLSDVLSTVLEGVSGRVLLYDRVKNRAALPGRVGRAFDLEAAVEQANRLAVARRSASAESHAAVLDRSAAQPRASAPDGQAEAVIATLVERAERPRLVATDHPHAHALGALVSELQGGFLLGDLSLPPPGDGASTDPPPSPAIDLTGPSNERGRSGTMPPPEGSEATVQLPPAPASEPAIPAEPAPPLAVRQVRAASALHHDLDRLRTETFALLEDAVGREHAAEHEAHVLDAHEIPSPVPPDRTVAYLRALLTDDPPRRRHGFKRARAKTYGTVAGKLLALHGAHRHLDSPLVHDAARLWTRLHR